MRFCAQKSFVFTTLRAEISYVPTKNMERWEISACIERQRKSTAQILKTWECGISLPKISINIFDFSKGVGGRGSGVSVETYNWPFLVSKIAMWGFPNISDRQWTLQICHSLDSETIKKTILAINANEEKIRHSSKPSKKESWETHTKHYGGNYKMVKNILNADTVNGGLLN